MVKFTLFLFLTFTSICGASSYKHNPEGYVIYCPCYGELGEQLMQLLDALSFAKGLNRSLVVPQFLQRKWIGNNYMTILHNYSSFFDMDELSHEGGVISIDDFMQYIAPKYWPLRKRYGFCHTFSKGSCGLDQHHYGDFWQENNVTFASNREQFSQYWGVEFSWSARRNYKTMYPAWKYPVLAYKHAPKINIKDTLKVENAQMRIKFQRSIMQQVETYKRKHNMMGNGVLAAMILNSRTLERFCQHTSYYKYGNFLASPQCTGIDRFWSRRTRQLTHDMCNPSVETIVGSITNISLARRNLKVLFISTDHPDDGMGHESLHIKNIKRALRKHPIMQQVHIVVRATYGDYSRWIFNLALMVKAQFFVGNCVDHYSSFVRRDIKLHRKKFIFFANQTTIPSII